MFGNGLEVATVVRASPAVGEGLIYRQLTALRAVTLGFLRSSFSGVVIGITLEL